MPLTRLLFATACASALLAGPTCAQEAANAIDIQSSVRMYKPVPKDLAVKRLYIATDDNPKLVTLLRDDLASKGYLLVEAPASADLTMTCRGRFNISGAGKETVAGNLEQFLQTAATPSPTAADIYHQDAGLDQIAAVTAGIGTIPVADILLWISQKIGIAGIVNRAITGDPRGICMHPDCDKFTQRVLVGCTGDIAWNLIFQAVSEKIVIDQVIVRALADMRGQFPTLPAVNK